MRKEKYITERQGKKGLTFQIKIPAASFTQSVSANDYGTNSDALKAAIQIRDDVLRDLRTGKLIKHTATVKELYELSLEILPSSKSSKDRYNAFYNKGIKGKGIELCPIDKVTAVDLQQNVNQYAREHTQDQVNRFVGIWKKIYKTAQLKEIPVTDKTLMVVIPKSKVVSDPKPVELSTTDFMMFLEAVRNYGIYTDKGQHRSETVARLLLTMYFTGIRPQEARALTVADIQGDMLRINKMIGSNEDSEDQIITTKTTRSIRRVPISAELSAMFDEWTKGKAKDDLLFPDFDGKPMTSDFFGNYIRHISRRSGIPFRSYQLRHLFASDLVKKTDLRTLQELMGHVGGSMTLSYARSSEAQKKKAIDER